MGFFFFFDAAWNFPPCLLRGKRPRSAEMNRWLCEFIYVRWGANLEVRGLGWGWGVGVAFPMLAAGFVVSSTQVKPSKLPNSSM